VKASDVLHLDEKGRDVKAEPAPSSAIAIIGIGCMFAKAPNRERFWANIKNRVDAITEVPASHWRPDDYLDKDPRAADRTYAARGGFLTPVDFPPLEFGIAPNTLEAIDTTQLLGLLVARDALDDAGYGPQRAFDRDRVSVILGVTGALELVIPLSARLGHPRWRRALAEAGVPEEQAAEVVRRIGNSYVSWQEDSFPGLLGNVVAGRIANRLDLGGTNCVVDAACASSLSALHLAILELNSGRSDMVLSGGLDAFNDIFMYMCFSKTPALSPTGNARPFDAGGDGTILGEGMGIVVLKRLADAVRDGDRVYAVIRGLGSSSDGKGHAIYAPSPAGQAKALHRAYRLAGVAPDTIELIEAHGTGTRAGDAAEVAALTDVYRSAARSGPWCAIGSVKSQIGHTKAAAGVAGLIKAALALHHRVLPPSIKVEQPIEPLRETGPLYVNTETRPWLARPGQPRRAAVSSFGFGGSNFHCVLEEFRPDQEAIDWDGDVQIVPFAADTPAQLQTALAAWPLAPTWDEVRLEASGARASFSAGKACRLALVLERERTDPVKLVANARALLDRQANKPAWSSPEGIYFGTGAAPGKLAMLFPGQGSQYVGMLRELACQFPQVQQSLAEADAAADDGRRPSDFIYPQPAFSAEGRARHEEALRATDVAQPALGALSLGALRTLEHFGVRAEAVAGHSYGELVALCAAGCFDAVTLHALSRLRGRLMADAAGEGGAMLAVFAARPQVEAILCEERLSVVIANHNAPAQTVLSGPTPEIVRAAEVLERRGIQARRLPVAAAFHSPAVAEARQTLEQALLQAPFAAPAIPVFANTTAHEYPHDPHAARLLLANQLVQPVEFVAEIENMYRAGMRTFVEVGPGNKLTGLVGAILEGREHAALSLDGSAGKRSGAADLARTLAQLAALGHTAALTPWEEGAHLARRPTLTIPICGTNYVKPTSAPASTATRVPAPARSSGPVQTAGHPLTGSNGAVTGPEKRNGTAPAKVSPAARVNVSTPGFEVVEPINQVRPVSEAAWPPVEHSTLAQALRATQENLVALQKLGEQTAQLHRQFLDGQDKTLSLFQTLLDQQQRLLQSSTTVAATVVSSAAPAARAPNELVPVTATPPSATPVRTETEQSVAPPTASNGHIQTLVLDVVAQKTGYPTEMLELDMELDADLGIDSIKRVEIFSALRERLPDTPTLQTEHLGALRSLRHVVDFLSNSHGSATPAAAPAPSVPVPPPGLAVQRGEPVHDVLLQVVAQKTGYPTEMLELDMELDADLGIDSIKRVEIFSALRERLPDTPTLQTEHLGALRSLRHVVEFLSTCPASTERSPETSAPANAGTDTERPGEAAPLHRYVLTAAALSEDSKRPAVALAAHGEIWITDDGSELAANVLRKLDVLGHRGRLIGHDARNLERPSRLAGLVVLAPAGNVGDSFLRDAFGLVQWAAPSLRRSGTAGGALLATVSRLDGAFGLRAARGNALSGGLAGLAKTAAHEWPEVHCKALDLAADWGAADDVVLALAEELLLVGPMEVGLSPLGKQVPCLTEVPLAGGAGSAPLGVGDVVVVTGGARGVTAEVAVGLARAFSPTLVLLGRSPEPHPEPAWLAALTDEGAIKRALMEQTRGPTSPREIGEQFRRLAANREALRNLERMQAAGARVVYRSVDVRDESAVRTVIEEVRAGWGPIAGLIHGAGVLADRLIEDKTLEQFDLVYGTKAAGLRGLLQAIPRKEMKLLVLFSSSTARFGRRGQVDYAIANEVLNKLAQQEARQRPGCRVVSVNWGPWAGGMVTPALQRAFDKEAVGLISLAAGADYLTQEISQLSDRPVEVVVLGGRLPATRPGPLLPKVNGRPLPQPNVREGRRAAAPAHVLGCAFERELNLEHYPFLQGHVLDGHAVLPLAMTLEWLAHGALHGNPGLAFHGFQELQALKGVILEEGRPCVLRVLAAKAERENGLHRVSVEMRSSAGTGRDILHARAEILLAASLPQSAEPAPEVAVVPYGRSPREIYQELLFHGPVFQGIEAVEGCSVEGIAATVKAAPTPATWIRQPLRSNWLADPMALDCAFQLLILWSFEQYGNGCLPCRVGRYRQFQRAFPGAGTRIVAAVTHHGPQEVRADLTFLDRSGQVIARMDDCQAVIDGALQQRFRRNRLPQGALPAT
jgi:acyl transferase domain-containing protein/NAD(P)-dependent dehydrogenase (short-subunit alcohol dehydrogenase family)